MIKSGMITINFFTIKFLIFCFITKQILKIDVSLNISPVLTQIHLQHQNKYFPIEGLCIRVIHRAIYFISSMRSGENELRAVL